MKAYLLFQQSESHNDLKVGEIAIPTAGEGEVRIKIHAISLNPVDYKLAAWKHPSWTYPHILGVDAAGTIDQVGSGVERWKLGDRVYFHSDLRRNGTFAEYIVTVAHTIASIPENVTFEQAAAIPCAGFTAWQAVHDRLKAKQNQTILVTGAAGGVGSFCVQLLHQIGATIIGTASHRRHENLKQLGANFLIDYNTEDISESVLKFTNGRKLDGIIDTVSPDSASSLLPLLRHAGGLVAINGRPKWDSIAPFSVSPSVHEVSLGAGYSFGDFESQSHLAEIGENMIKLVSEGAIDPMIRKTITFEEIPNALEELFQRHVEGKIICTLN